MTLLHLPLHNDQAEPSIQDEILYKYKYKRIHFPGSKDPIALSASVPFPSEPGDRQKPASAEERTIAEEPAKEAGKRGRGP